MQVDLTGKIALNDYVTKAGAVAQFSGINPYSVVGGSAQGLPSRQTLFVAEAGAQSIERLTFDQLESEEELALLRCVRTSANSRFWWPFCAAAGFAKAASALATVAPPIIDLTFPARPLIEIPKPASSFECRVRLIGLVGSSCL